MKLKAKGDMFAEVALGHAFRSMDDFALVLYRLASEAQKIARDARNSEGVMCVASVIADELRERADRTGQGMTL
jgi:hypothetical protein